MLCRLSIIHGEERNFSCSIENVCSAINNGNHTCNVSFMVRAIKSTCIVIHGYRCDTSNDDKLRIVFFLLNANLFNENQPTVQVFV